MAATKPKKDRGSSPNVVLVIFLIFFVLITIGLGVWVYYDQDALAKTAADAQNARTALNTEKIRRDYFNMLTQEYRLAVGETLTPEEIEGLNTDRAVFWAAGFGKFKDEKSREAMHASLKALKQRLGGGEEDKDPKTTFPKEYDALKKRVTDLEGALNNEIAKNKKTEDHFAALAAQQKTFHDSASANIQKGSDAALRAAQKNSLSVAEIVENNRKLTKELADAADKALEDAANNQKIVAKMEIQIAAMLRDRAQDPKQAQANPSRNDLYPLLLDISPGKPLWDNPVGKVMRVEPGLRQITINVGSAQGAKPELTFNIFGTGSSGRAEKQLKGSLEIVRVVDTATSIAKITSLYDADGREIALNDVSRTRVLRETEAPIREGDLLFNLFWGTRVAVAGYVSLTGDPSDNPAEQVRQMEDFAYLLQRNGMQVDSYVDMRDGQIRGNISSKTRYLILGDELRSVRKGKAKDDDDPAEPANDRASVVNASNLALRKFAVANGLLLISAENFATVIGYRRARSANNPEVSTFRPTLPFAGDANLGGLNDLRPNGQKK